MTFIWPWVLLAMLVLPVSVFFYVRLYRKRSRDAARLGAFGAVRVAATSSVGRRRHIPPIVFLVGVALLVLASARPQVEVPLPRREGIVVLVFDVSASMGAEDAEPNRLGAAQSVARALIERRPDSAKIGVVAFGEGGLVVQPPTDDSKALDATIDRLVPQSGTSLGVGILTALNVLTMSSDISEGPLEPESSETSETRGAFAPAIIVLLTDGENTDPPDPLEMAQSAINLGVRIYTVGVGSAEGATLEIDGFVIFSQLNEVVLQEIALLTEGNYFRVEDAGDIQLIYEELETEFVVEPREIEVTAVVGGISSLLLLAGGAMSMLWFGRIP